MINLEVQKERFNNHIAKLSDYGNIKVLDFKDPNSSEYRIRFLFEEDYCRLHISGDLGELTATNYNNMTFEKFSDFSNNAGYFEEKIDCHSRPIYTFDSEDVREDLRELFEEFDLYDSILAGKLFDFESDEERINDVIDDILCDYSEETGHIGSKGYDVLSEYLDDPWEYVQDLGKRETGILDLYMLAFRLAMAQLEEGGAI